MNYAEISIISVDISSNYIGEWNNDTITKYHVPATKDLPDI